MPGNRGFRLRCSRALLALFAALFSGCGQRSPAPENLASHIRVVKTEFAPFTTEQGQAIRDLFVTYENTGTKPVVEMHGDYLFYDAAGKETEQTYRDRYIFVADPEPIAPGRTLRQHQYYVYPDAFGNYPASAKVVIATAFEHESPTP